MSWTWSLFYIYIYNQFALFTIAYNNVPVLPEVNVLTGFSHCQAYWPTVSLSAWHNYRPILLVRNANDKSMFSKYQYVDVKTSSSFVHSVCTDDHHNRVISLCFQTVCLQHKTSIWILFAVSMFFYWSGWWVLWFLWHFFVFVTNSQLNVSLINYSWTFDYSKTVLNKIFRKCFVQSRTILLTRR